MKQHNFKVGDKLESDFGITCIVARIDPVHGNVYAKNFSDNRLDNEIYRLSNWRAVKPPVAAVVTVASDFVDSYDKFEVTILRNIASDPFEIDSIGATFVHRATVDNRDSNLPYDEQVREYLKSVATTTTLRGRPGEYIAIAIYGDSDTICVKFSTEKVEQSIAVNFDA